MTSPGLRLDLLPSVAAFRHDSEPVITASLRNDGDRTLRLVMPGDGSVQKRRTPFIEWVFTPDPDRAGAILLESTCGNINGIRQDEVFALAPGESRSLGEWILPQCFPDSSQFLASIIYTNDPTAFTRGVDIPENAGDVLALHDETALALVRASDPCRVQSNQISISFEDYPTDALPYRIREWCDEPQISVRALILALGRFHIASAQVVSDLEQRWRLFRREQRLDLQGARLESSTQ